MCYDYELSSSFTMPQDDVKSDFLAEFLTKNIFWDSFISL